MSITMPDSRGTGDRTQDLLCRGPAVYPMSHLSPPQNPNTAVVAVCVWGGCYPCFFQNSLCKPQMESNFLLNNKVKKVKLKEKARQLREGLSMTPA